LFKYGSVYFRKKNTENNYDDELFVQRFTAHSPDGAIIGAIVAS